MILLHVASVQDVQLTPKCTEPFLIQGLRKNISQLIFGVNMTDNNIFSLNVISKKMMTNINMLRSRVLHWIMGNFVSTLVIRKQWNFLHKNTIIFQRLLEPQNLSASWTDSNVLGFSRRNRYVMSMHASILVEY